MNFSNSKKVSFKQQPSDTLMWKNLIEQAREKIKHSDWDAACIAYKEAFFIAEKLLCNQCQKNCTEHCAVSCYLNTAEEFAFAMRKNNFDCALEMFIYQIKENIALKEPLRSVTELTRRLMAVASSPQPQLDQLYRQYLFSENYSLTRSQVS